MAVYFVSSADGNDGNSGTDLDNAWATYAHAEVGSLAAGDYVFIRPTHSETLAADINTTYDGTVASPIWIGGIPRDAHAVSSSDWTNGSTTVTIDDNDMTESEHEGRYITGPDGQDYLITRVSATNTIIIEREYAGSNASNQAVTIKADDAKSAWDDYDDSGDTIKKTDWEGDQTRPVIDFDDGDYNLYIFDSNYRIFENIEFKDTTSSDGLVRLRRSYQTAFIGCLFKQSVENDPLVTCTNIRVFMKRCILKGSGSGTNQKAILGSYLYTNMLQMKDCAIYNMGDNGIAFSGQIFLENVNIGVEVANGDDDIAAYLNTTIKGRDVKLGGTNGDVSFEDYAGNILEHVSFENYNKILGAHKSFYLGGNYEYVAVSGETPNKKVSDYVWKISPNISFAARDNFWAVPIFTHELELDASEHTLKYWIYNDTGGTLNASTATDDIYLCLEYISAYDDTSEYVIKEVTSTETNIADAADADDWDYLQITFTPAFAGKVRVNLCIKNYNAANSIYVDPAVVIS